MPFDACDLTAIEPQPDGRVRLVLVAHDDTAGEKVARDVLLAGAVTTERLQAEARQIVDTLNVNRVSVKELTLGPIDLTPPKEIV